MAHVNQPYNFMLFYFKVPPTEAHEQLNVLRNPPAWNRVSSYGKYRFGRPPGLDPDSLAPLYSAPKAGGTAGYEVRGGEDATGRRILLVQTP